MAVFRPFGKRLSSRITQGVFYVAWLSMVAGFFRKSGPWFDISLPLMLLSFFLVGALITFSDREGLVDFFGPETKSGRDLSNPVKAASLIKGVRFLGIFFMGFMVYLGYEMFHDRAMSFTWH
jgi:hypothetical protein